MGELRYTEADFGPVRGVEGMLPSLTVLGVRGVASGVAFILCGGVLGLSMSAGGGGELGVSAMLD